MPFSDMRGNFCNYNFFKLQVHSTRLETKSAVEIYIYINSHLKITLSQILCNSQISTFIMHGKIDPLVCM